MNQVSKGMKHAKSKLSNWHKLMKDPKTKYSRCKAKSITAFVEELGGELQNQVA